MYCLFAYLFVVSYHVLKLDFVYLFVWSATRSHFLHVVLKNRAILVSFNESARNEDGIFTRKNDVKLTEYHMTLSRVSCIPPSRMQQKTE